MISNITKGRSFHGVLRYVHGKDGAERIGGSVIGATPNEVAEEFKISQRVNRRVAQPVYHISLSVPHHERLEDHVWNDIANDYLDQMGFGNRQYALYRHTDRDHDHIHIIASRIQLTNGKAVSDSWDYRRSEAVVRALEEKYELTPVAPSWEKDTHSPTVGECRLEERTGQPGARRRLQSILQGVLDQKHAQTQTLPEFIDQLQQAGVSVQISRAGTRARGISFKLDEVAFSGSKLGRRYSLPGLQREGISYNPHRDDDGIEELLERPIVDPNQRQWAKEIAPIAARLMVTMHQAGQTEETGPNQWHYRGTRYAVDFDKDDDCFSVSALDERGLLLKMRGQDEVQMAQAITEDDLSHFQNLHQMLIDMDEREQERDEESQYQRQSDRHYDQMEL